MQQEKRDKNDYLDLSRWEIQNFYRTSSVDNANKRTPPSAPLRYKFVNFLRHNLVGWIVSYVKNRFGRRHNFETYTGTAATGIFPLENNTSMALLSDWATNTDEAIAIAKLAKGQDPDYTIHLGDVYFVGNKEEILHNFDEKNEVWQYGKRGSLAVPGNHEYYANGNAFFDTLLKDCMYVLDAQQQRTPQSASFFCLENEHWRVIGLDTGYHSCGKPLLEFLPFCAPDCRLHQKQLDWLKEAVRLNDPADKRGILFLGHHQYFCAFGSGYPKQAKQIKDIMDKAARPVLWFWGHEHILAFYDKNKIGNGIEAYGRCIGNGGMPVEIAKKVKDKKIKKTLLKYYDVRFNHTMEVPRFFSFLKPKKVKLGFNAFAMLRFEGASLKIAYIDQGKRVLMEEHWRTDAKGGVEMYKMVPSEWLTEASPAL